MLFYLWILYAIFIIKRENVAQNKRMLGNVVLFMDILYAIFIIKRENVTQNKRMLDVCIKNVLLVFVSRTLIRVL